MICEHIVYIQKQIISNSCSISIVVQDTISDVQIVVHQFGKNGLFFPSKSLKNGLTRSIRVCWLSVCFSCSHLISVLECIL